MSKLNAAFNLPRPLADGLLLRQATSADTEAVAALNARILAEEDESPQLLEMWTHDLMSGRHPTNTAENFVVVEDTNSGQIISSACLIPQVWQYEAIPFGVGRPELVVTDPAYRRRGLVRTIFETLHTLSAAQGHLVQGITGIPWFYRQFGYEYALPLGGAHHLGLSDIPTLAENETEPFQVRPATAADIPVMSRMYQHQCVGKLVTTILDEARWRYDLDGHSPDSVQKSNIYCLLTQAGQVIGYYTTANHIWGGRLSVWEIAAEGVSLHAVLPTAVRAMKAQAEIYQARLEGKAKPLTGLRLALGLEHPTYAAFQTKLGSFQKAYAWYIRVADLPGFIRHIAPALEKRLAASVMSGYSGELKLSFYRDGLRLAFEQGRLTEAINWPVPASDQQWEGAEFPPLVFLQLLFGYRSFDELGYAFPDCWADEEPGLLLKALFPKQTSWVLPLG